MSPTTSMIDRIRRFTVFTEVSDERLAQMSREVTLLELDRGANVWNEGDAGRFLFLILDGRVKLIKHSETGKDVIVDIFGPRDAIGEATLLEGGSYNTTAVCLTATALLCVPRQQMLDLLATVPGVALRSLRGMARRQRMLMQKIKELAAGGVEYRIAHLLLKLGERLGEADDEGTVTIPVVLSRQDVADLVGTTVETAIRVMSRWRKMGIVTNDKRGIVILDRETLEDLASGITSHV